MAQAHQEGYKRIKALRGQLGPRLVTAKDMARVRLQCKQRAIANWRQELAEDNPAGRRVIEAIGPNLTEWLVRCSGRTTFHMAQVLTGHGCFGEYLRKIGKEATAQCHHCAGREIRMVIDTADHTLTRCPAWQDERDQLKEKIGNDVSLPVIIGKMTQEEDGGTWKAFAAFCGRIMRKKEDAERMRRGEQPPSPPDLPRPPRHRGEGASHPR